jgi:lipoic acid synthetase
MLQELEIKTLKGESKTSRLKIKPDFEREPLKKPDWIRIRLSSSQKVNQLKKTLREQSLFTVCEEAQCPNLNECFNHGTATFMIMGQICTRRCPFCDVAHGRPKPLDINEPLHLAQTIAKMSLKYVVITSVDRDDLRDGGASHFKACIDAIKSTTPEIKIEILTPDFRGRMEKALETFNDCPPDVFNHNLETVPSLYPRVRPGADYQHVLPRQDRLSQELHLLWPCRSVADQILGLEDINPHSFHRSVILIRSYNPAVSGDCCKSKFCPDIWHIFKKIPNFHRFLAIIQGFLHKGNKPAGTLTKMR